MLIAGDIGGTKTLLSCYQKDDLRTSLYKKRYPCKGFGSLEEIIKVFIEEFNIDPTISKACFALAGPIKNGHCTITNLPWEMEEPSIQSEFGFQKVKFINDFEAVGYGIQVLNDDEFITLNKGEETKEGTIAVLGAGTGLGEAYMNFSQEQNRYIVYPTEGGHSSFSPHNELEIHFLQYLMTKEEHVSFEGILAGKGLVKMYSFLKESGRFTESEKINEEMKTNDSAAVISQYGLNNEDKLCEEALDLFASIYGVESSNLALKFFALGGVYLAGGISPKIKEKLLDGTFMKSFLHKGKFRDFLTKIPVKIVMNEESGLIGATYIASKL
ncbi:MAG: glucokinase [Nitrospinae bacterium]|nr:glucokinase [Nitrospinota bacterium]